MKEHIRQLMAAASVEITPGGAEKIPDFRDVLRPATDVFVTFLPGSDFQATLATCQRLQQEEMIPIPHIAARSIPSAAFLDTQLKALAEMGVRKLLLIGGGIDTPLGPFTSTVEILESGVLETYGFEQVGVAGHPEGSPDISPEAIREALAYKNAYAASSGAAFHLTTQFCFEAEPVIAWARQLEREGNTLPISVGIPGLATVKTLLRHAQACGIGNSMRVLRKQAANISKLLTVRDPGKMVADLAPALAGRSHHLTRLHMYPLGGLVKTARWMNAIIDGHFELDSKRGIVVDDV